MVKSGKDENLLDMPTQYVIWERKNAPRLCCRQSGSSVVRPSSRPSPVNCESPSPDFCGFLLQQFSCDRLTARCKTRPYMLGTM